MLTVTGIHKSYEGEPLLRGVSFTVGQGETICLLGRSGSGKSTLLRIIAGLETAESGAVTWDGQSLADVPVHRRGFGLMFQDYALFPHRTVSENVAFGLRMQNLPRVEIAARVREALAQVNMQDFAHRRVTDLSGGEQQRVALARALAPRPRLLMLDEPLGALDRTLREQLIEELRRVLHQTGIPAIYVTHDQEEAFAFGDRLVLLRDGLVEQQGPPAEVYNRPASAWVARFFGQSNLLDGKLISQTPPRVRTALGVLETSLPGPRVDLGAPVTVLLRPYGARAGCAGEDHNHVTGVVEDVFFRGDNFRVQIRPEGGPELSFLVDDALPLGQPVTLCLPPDAVLVLAEASAHVA
jgi:ABC-type Fe3+/spermidine/putrescine transport system ATPase subunit